MRRLMLGLLLIIGMAAVVRAGSPLEEADRLDRETQPIWGREMVRIEVLLRQALELREAALPPDDPRIADTLNRLGRNEFNQGRMARAESWFRRELDINDRVRPSSFENSRTLGDLGAALREQCRLPEAERLVRRSLALRIALRIDGMAPWQASSLDNLSKIYEMMGRLDEAVEAAAAAARMLPAAFEGRLGCLRRLRDAGGEACWKTECPPAVG